MNRSMSQVDQITQRNATASEELAAAAEEMSAQAEALRQLSDFFAIEDGGRPSRPAPRVETRSSPSKRDFHSRTRPQVLHASALSLSAASADDKEYRPF
jgi:methyl-accepting chemotaxis protein